MIRFLSTATLSVILLVGQCDAFTVSHRTPIQFLHSNPTVPSIIKNDYVSTRVRLVGKRSKLESARHQQMDEFYRQDGVRLDALLPGTYGLLLTQIVVFLADKVMGNPLIRRCFYLHHHSQLRSFWQPITSLFCHRDSIHLSNNLFLLLVMGRSVEAEFGRNGVLFSFLCCGAITSAVALWTLPRYTVSIGAIGAIMGLFFMSAMSTLRSLHWRTLLDLGIMGFFLFRQFAIDISTAAFGSKRTVKVGMHVAGALVGAIVSRWCLTNSHHIRARVILPAPPEQRYY